MRDEILAETAPETHFSGSSISALPHFYETLKVLAAMIQSYIITSGYNSDILKTLLEKRFS